MTTEATIGRFGQSVDIGIASWDVDGDQVKVSGYITNTDTTMLTLARAQLAGLDEPDTSIVVPVTWVTDPTVDGYYRVDATSVNTDVSRWAAKSLPFSVDLTRVRNYRWPDINIRTYGDVRQNVDSFTTGNTFPLSFTPVDATVATVATVNSYATAFGSVRLNQDTALNDSRLRYKVAPANYYEGACRVEQKIGSTWYPLIGRQVRDDAANIRVNNGLLRITAYTNASPARSGLSMESWVTSTTWGAAKTLGISDQATDCITGGPVAVEIISNRPEEAKVRFSFPSSISKFEILSVTVKVRRGHRMADVQLKNSESVQWELDSSVALSSGTGGAQESADDANSQRVVFGLRSAATVGGTGNKEIQYGASSKGITFGWGVRDGSGTAPWGSSIGTVLNRWFAYVGETQRVGS